MQNGKESYVAAAASPLLRSVQAVVVNLPADDSVVAAQRVVEALESMNSNRGLAPAERQEAIGLLDAAAANHTQSLLREYLNTTRHTRQRESALWHGAYQCWQALAAAYALCVPVEARSAAAGGSDTGARVAAARAIRALRWQLQWLRIRFAPPPSALWEALAALWARSEAADMTGAIVLYPGMNSTLEGEILSVLALSLMKGENLMPLEQDWVMRLVKRYAREFTLSRSPATGCTHSFDLRHPQAPAPLGVAALPGADLRYFGAAAAVASLGEALRGLEQDQVVPGGLGMDLQVDPALLATVARQTYLDWAGKPQERRHQREKINARISVLPGFAQIANEIDRSMADPFDFTAKAAGESWIASDISPDGFGVLMPAVSGDWVSVGSVLGVEGEAAGAWSVGIVRRVRRLDGGQQHIGVQVLCRHAQAVRVMRESSGAGTGVTQRMPVDRGILLTPDAMQQPQIELLVSDAALYGKNTLHVLTSEGELLVKLHAVRETLADCACVTLVVVGAET